MSVLLQAAQWLGIKKKVRDKKKEVIVLESQEQRIEKEEIRLAEVMIRDFTGGTQGILIPSSTKINEEKARESLSVLSKLEQDLMNMKIYHKRLQRLSQKLRSDLLDMRGASDKANYNVIQAHLSHDERRVLDYILRLSTEITNVVEEIRQLRNSIESINRDRTYFQSNPGRAEDNARQIREKLSVINNLLVSLKQHLVELFSLETTVEELTKTYVNQ